MEIKQKVTVKNKSGLHVRPATLLAQKANSFTSNVFLEKDGVRVNAKSCIELLTIAAVPGTEFTVIASGSDSKEAIESLKKLFESNFGEKQ